MMRKREGFTLVELLVVIAIIIILAAILFPVFARARDKAQQTRCINNMKQMGAACALYEDDYDAYLPGMVTTGETYGYMWKDLMDPYIKSLKGGPAGYLETEGEVFQCASAPIEESAIAWQASRNIGYNLNLRRDTSTSAVKFPSSTLRLTETSQKDPDGDPNAADPGGSWWMPFPDPATAGGFYRYAPGWHSGMNDCLWVDGHVSSIPRQRVMLTDNYVGPNGVSNGNVWARFTPKPGYTPDG